MIRKIIKIDEEKCNGCRLCVDACHEGAIGMVDGKAKLLRDDYCDGLGDCLPVCPTGAISFVEREALAYNEEEVKRNMEKSKAEKKLSGGCPGIKAKSIKENEDNTAKNTLPCGCPGQNAKSLERTSQKETTEAKRNMQSHLRQWPVQIKLVPANAPYFDGAKLLIAADCAAYAYADFHQDFIKNHITIIGCPKLDQEEYTEKLTAIIKNNNIKSVKIVRMEVPCCSGIAHAAKNALQNSGKMIPWQIFTISTNGEVIEE